MEHLGQVFRFFREARHISLSEATGGEFSKSMLSRALKMGRANFRHRNFLALSAPSTRKRKNLPLQLASRIIILTRNS